MISLISGILKQKDTAEILTDFENKLIVTKGNMQGEGWTGDLGLAYAHWDICNDWPTGTCLIAEGTHPIFCDDLYGKRN